MDKDSRSNCRSSAEIPVGNGCNSSLMSMEKVNQDEWDALNDLESFSFRSLEPKLLSYLAKKFNKHLEKFRDNKENSSTASSENTKLKMKARAFYNDEQDNDDTFITEMKDLMMLESEMMTEGITDQLQRMEIRPRLLNDVSSTNAGNQAKSSNKNCWIGKTAISCFPAEMQFGQLIHQKKFNYDQNSMPSIRTNVSRPILKVAERTKWHPDIQSQLATPQGQGKQVKHVSFSGKDEIFPCEYLPSTTAVSLDDGRSTFRGN